MTPREERTKRILLDCCEITEALHRGMDYVEQIKTIALCEDKIDREHFELVAAMGDWLKYKTVSYTE